MATILPRRTLSRLSSVGRAVMEPNPANLNPARAEHAEDIDRKVCKHILKIEESIPSNSIYSKSE